MNRLWPPALIGSVALLFAGCTANLPFNLRPSFDTVVQARSLDAKGAGPVAVKWVPASFPSRVDVQPASGFVNGALRTPIPIGPGLSGRILETLDAAVGVSPTAAKVLTLTVKNAHTQFKYSTSLSTITPAMKRASCDLDINFTLGATHWSQDFHVELTSPNAKGTGETALVGQVWDAIALQVTKNVVAHMQN